MQLRLFVNVFSVMKMRGFVVRLAFGIWHLAFGMAQQPAAKMHPRATPFNPAS
jgi:hypothetical protein